MFKNIVTQIIENGYIILTYFQKHFWMPYTKHIKSTQCIEETNTNLQINGYLPHTTDFIFINCMATSTNRLHLLSTFTLYTVSVIVGNIESNLKKKVLAHHT